MTMKMTWLRAAGVAAAGIGVLFAGTGVAVADDPNAVPPALLDTHCSLDQLMAATKVVDRPLYDGVVWKYSQETPWMQQHAIYHMNLFLQKDPADRQAEVDELGAFFPQYAALFRTQESSADAVAAKCTSLPVVDPTVWVPSSNTAPVDNGPAGTNAAADPNAPVNPAPVNPAPAGTEQVGAQQVGAQQVGTQQIGTQQIGTETVGTAPDNTPVSNVVADATPGEAATLTDATAVADQPQS